MDKIKLIEELKKKKELSVYAKMAFEDESVLSVLFEIIETDKSSVKFFCEKIIRSISQTNPEILYPYFDVMVKFLKSSNNFIKWGFALSIPNLLKTGDTKKWKCILLDYLEFLESDSVVTYCNGVGGLSTILTEFPEFEDKIIPVLLDVDKHVFRHKGELSPECTRVAKAQIIACFDSIYDFSEYKKQMIRFAEDNISCSRKKVHDNALKFLKRVNPDCWINYKK